MNCLTLTDIIQSHSGTAGFKAFVFHAGTDTLCPLYSDRSLKKLLANPLETDTDGAFFSAFVCDDRYRIVILDRYDRVVSQMDDITLYSGLESTIGLDYTDARALLDDDHLSYGAGAGKQQVYPGLNISISVCCEYVVAAPAATDHHLTTSGGVKLYVLPTPNGDFSAVAFGIDNTGATDVSAMVEAMDQAIDGTIEWPAGTYLFQNTVNKRVGNNWVATGMPVGAQAPQHIHVVFKVDGPTNGIFLNIDNSNPSAGETNTSFKGIAFQASNASKDQVTALRFGAKLARVEGCSFKDFATGIKLNNVESWVDKNYFSSCNICIDDSGGENHITDNHGFPGTEGTAILLRLSNSVVRGNKFFGDGGDANYGCVVWGSGNTISGNVFDAFIEAGIWLVAHNSEPFSPGNPMNSNNTITGNTLYGNGNHGDASGSGRVGAYNCGLLVSANNHSPDSNIFVGNAIYNMRSDRSMANAVVFDAMTRSIDNHILVGNTFRNSVNKGFRKLGVANSIVRKSNVGLKTESFGLANGYNGLTIQHDLDLSPSIVEVVPESNLIGAIGVDNINTTSFRLLMRDSTGALVTAGSPVAVRWTAKAV